MKKTILFAFSLFAFFSFLLQAESNLPLHLKIMETKTASGPEIWKNYIFLTAHPDRAVNLVGVAFDFENYRIIHPYALNDKGIYVFSMPFPDKNTINYRMIIDGLWMPDPLCKNNRKDENGIIVSTVNLPTPRPIKVTGPVLTDTGETRFSIRTIPGSTVSLVGTFNGWDPYMTPLSETSEGVYSADLRLRQGSYYYYFIVDGKKALDPMNFARARNVEGEEVCRIDIY